MQGDWIFGCCGAHDCVSSGGHCPAASRESSGDNEGATALCVCVCVCVCVMYVDLFLYENLYFSLCYLPLSLFPCLPPIQSFLSDHSSSLTPSHCVFTWLCYISVSRLGQLPSSLFTHRDYLDTTQPLRLLTKVRVVRVQQALM